MQKELKVLYEDNHLIAVFKPAGILTQGDKTGDESLMDEVKKYLKEKYKKPGNVFLGLIHRLDRPVSGIVLFAKTSKGASRLSEQFRNRTVKKTYLAYVWGKPERSRATLVHYLDKDEQRNIVTAYTTPAPDRDRAELEYELVESTGDKSIVKVNLKTGKSHQIRVQLSSIGCPIVGDVKYGAKEALPDGSICLCAAELEFETATSGERKHIVVDNPFAGLC